MQLDEASPLPLKGTHPGDPDVTESICCPRCHAALQPGEKLWRCSASVCTYAELGFPVSHGQPVLVDFERSIFLRAKYEEGAGSVLPRDVSGRGFRTRLRQLALGKNPIAARTIATTLRLLKAKAERPLLLVIGGGSIGEGVRALYEDPKVAVVGTDVYASPHTQYVVDGHHLPFRDGVFDGVLVQAVLEHVLQPHRVVEEIHRVLRPEGVVYADTPFMQPVHEGAWDFTRFTRSGHRWLFRRFSEIEAGSVGGAGSSLIWSIRYYVRALTGSNPLATIAALPWFWLRWLEGVARPQQNADAASGHYFLGRREETATLQPTDMIAYYKRQA